MSANRALQSASPLVEEATSDTHIADQALHIRDLDVLTDAHLRTLFHYSRRQFCTLKAQGRFRRFAFREQLSSRIRYSGALVRAYLANEGPARTFGGTRPRRQLGAKQRVTNHTEHSAAGSRS